MLNAPKPTSNHEVIPAGTHVARLYRIVHAGTVPDSYQGQPRQTDQLLLTFELCGEKRIFKEGDEAKPMSISSRWLSFSMGKKSNLRKLVEGMTGVTLKDEEAYAFDLEQLLGDACLLTLVHRESNDQTYTNILSAAPLIKGMEAPKVYNTPKLIDVTMSPIEEIDALPQFMQDKIKSSEEWKKRTYGDIDFDTVHTDKETLAKDAIGDEDSPF